MYSFRNDFYLEQSIHNAVSNKRFVHSTFFKCLFNLYSWKWLQSGYKRNKCDRSEKARKKVFQIDSIARKEILVIIKHNLVGYASDGEAVMAGQRGGLISIFRENSDNFIV